MSRAGGPILLVENDYDDVLPSLNLRYKATDNFYVRFAVAKGIARPEFPQLLPSIQISPLVGRIRPEIVRAQLKDSSRNRTM